MNIIVKRAIAGGVVSAIIMGIGTYILGGNFRISS